MEVYPYRSNGDSRSFEDDDSVLANFGGNSNVRYANAKIWWQENSFWVLVMAGFTKGFLLPALFSIFLYVPPAGQPSKAPLPFWVSSLFSP